MAPHIDQKGSDMRRPLGAAALTSLVAALSLGFSATAVQAATLTWTVTPGGAITGAAGTTTLKDNTAGLTVTCTSSSTTGTLKSGSGLSGTGIGSVTSLTFNNCSVDGITLTVATGTVSYPLNLKSYKSGTSSGKIAKIHFSVTSSVCSFDINGTSATANNGSVRVKYGNKAHTLKVLPSGSTLHIYNVSGCLGLINNGDSGSVSGAFVISPAQKITAS
jgi:hypothetical protein